MSVRFWKAVVISMGALIVVGLLVVAVTLIQRTGQLGDAPPPPASDVVTPVAIPAGSELTGTAVSGNRLALTLRLADGSVRVVVVDVASGATLRAIDLQPAP